MRATAFPPPALRCPRVAALAVGLLFAPAVAGAFPPAPTTGVAGAGSNPPPILAALTPSAGELPRWGAIYATASAAGFGLTVGLADRQEARRAAESQCRSAGGVLAPAARCLLVAEFAERCAAVAQGVERRAMPSRGPRVAAGFVVTSVAAGAGRTAEEAESAALEACERADGRGFCLIAASACGPRR